MPAYRGPRTFGSRAEPRAVTGEQSGLPQTGLSQTGLPLGADRRPPGFGETPQPLMQNHPLVTGETAPMFMPHRPPRPEKSEGGVASAHPVRATPKGDQPAAIAELVAAGQRARARPGAARRHRLRQDLHHGQGDRGDAAPGAGARAQQDARRPALWRVQELLPRQRGRVLRLLLRLLPARGLRPAHRHLHREGIVDQRADRPHAPRGDARAARARRRHHRRLACPASTASARSRPTRR